MFVPPERSIEPSAIRILFPHDSSQKTFELPQSGIKDRTDLIKLGWIVDYLALNAPFPGITPDTNRYWRPGEYVEQVEDALRNRKLMYRGQRYNGTISTKSLTTLDQTASLVDQVKNARRQFVPQSDTFNFWVLMGLDSTAARNFGEVVVRTTLYVHSYTPTVPAAAIRMKNTIQELPSDMTIDQLIITSGWSWLANATRDVRKPSIVVSKTQ